MKLFTYNHRSAVLACVAILFASIKIAAQCNVNDKYDKIISGYHSSIAIKNTGALSIWGSGMKADGTTDQLVPQDINATNYPTLTGSILKAALGGNTSNSKVDQAILLTSDGLWAWGIEGAVINTSLTMAGPLPQWVHRFGNK